MQKNGEFLFYVDNKNCGSRLDIFISSNLENCSRNLAANLIKKGIVRVNDSKKKSSYKLKTGEKIFGNIPEPEAISFKPEKIELNIIYEDEQIIIINKAAGMVVHPAPGHFSGTMVNALLYHCSDLKGIGGELRPGIVHRLDKDTTGVIVVAKTQFAHNKLTSFFKLHEMKKEYIAIVYGEFKSDAGTITLPIGRHPIDRKKMSTKSPYGKIAITNWKVKENLNGLTLLDINLKTGRTHQIRVHFSTMNHPLVGDSVYGKNKKINNQGHTNKLSNILQSVTRQMLHAKRLSFKHPVSNKLMCFEAPIPKDMNELLIKLRDVSKNSDS